MTEPTPHPVMVALTELRKTQGISQVQVGAELGCSGSAISLLEHGHTDPRMSHLMRYARAVGAQLQITVDDKEAPDA